MSGGRSAFALAMFAALAAGPVLAGEPGDGQDKTPPVTTVPPTVHSMQSRALVEPRTSTPGTAVLYPGGGSMPATVLGPARSALPGVFARKRIELAILEPLSFPDAVRRLGVEAEMPTRVEERPSRVVDGAVTHGAPPPVTVNHKGSLVDLLDRLATGAGYNWDWDAGTGSVVFHRYWDIEQRGPMNAPSREPGIWIVDPARHDTVQEVLEHWAGMAGWRMDWQSNRDFTVSAYARFVGGFLRATDQMMSSDQLRRVLKVKVHHGNRWLVVEDAGI